MKVVHFSFSLYLSLSDTHKPMEIFSPDTIQRDDVDGELFRQGNRKGKMNLGHEKERGGKGKKEDRV